MLQPSVWWSRSHLPPANGTPILGKVRSVQAGGTHPTGMLSCYHSQMKFAKVIFSQVSVCPQGGACVAGGHVWWGVHGRGHAWQRGMHGRGCA